MGMTLPREGRPTIPAINSWLVVYDYYWAALFIFLGCLIAFTALTRRHKHDIFDLTSISARLAMALLALSLWLVGHFHVELIEECIHSVMIVPTAVITLTIITAVDRCGREAANWRLRRKKSAQTSSPEVDRGDELCECALGYEGSGCGQPS